MTLSDFKTTRLLRRLNLAAQIVLFASLTLLVNLIAMRSYARHDLTPNRKYALSGETVAYLGVLEKPVSIYLTRPGDVSLVSERIVADDLERLLAEFVYESQRSGGVPINVERIDIYLQPEMAEKLVRDFGVSPEAKNALVVSSGDRFKQIEGAWLYDTDEQGNNLFTGERALVSAILEVASGSQLVARVLAGHQELDIEDTSPVRGLSQATDYLRQRNWRVEPIDLALTGAIPKDTNLLIIAAPQFPLIPAEVQRIGEYLAGGGNAMILLEPLRQHGLDDLLAQWGLVADDKLVIETADDALVGRGEMLVSRYTRHPTTDFLVRNQLKVLLGLTRPIVIDLEATFEEGRTVAAVMGSSEASWAEADYRAGGLPEYQQGVDVRGPVPMAMAVERLFPPPASPQPPVRSRLLVVGNAGLFANARLNTAANLQFFHNSVIWLSQRNPQLLGIQPRSWRPSQFTISAFQYQAIAKQLLWGPGIVGLAGIIVALIRR